MSTSKENCYKTLQIIVFFCINLSNNFKPTIILRILTFKCQFDYLMSQKTQLIISPFVFGSLEQQQFLFSVPLI